MDLIVILFFKLFTAFVYDKTNKFLENEIRVINERDMFHIYDRPSIAHFFQKRNVKISIEYISAVLNLLFNFNMSECLALVSNFTYFYIIHFYEKIIIGSFVDYSQTFMGTLAGNKNLRPICAAVP